MAGFPVRAPLGPPVSDPLRRCDASLPNFVPTFVHSGLTCSNAHRNSTVVCRSTEGNEFPGEQLSAQFSQFVNEQGLTSPAKHRSPSHLMSPNAVVAAQMDALQLNDWPEIDSGITTAFKFSKPYECIKLLPGQTYYSHCRSWGGKEEWFTLEEFSKSLHSKPYTALLSCENWKPVSQVEFPSRRFDVAVQAVEVTAKDQADQSRSRQYRFTFCLEKIPEGAFKNCWLTVGVRSGDYVNI